MTTQEIETIKEKVYLPDIVAETEVLHRSGTGYSCRCPFHADRSPSFHLYAPSSDKNYWTYKCYGCDKSGDAIQYIMERDNLAFNDAVKKLAESVNVNVNDKSCQGTKKAPSRHQEPPKKPYYLALTDAVQQRQSSQSDFCKWLGTIFAESDVNAAVERYHLGTTIDGHVIYWQIDSKGFIRSGKIMKYGSDGHRLRNGEKDAPDWVHSRLVNAIRYNSRYADLFMQIGRANPVPTSKWQLNQVFFGSHLLHDAPQGKGVCIVESEKSAVIMSMLKSDFVWLSCGGFSMLATCLINSRDVLAGRRILVFPDKTKGGHNFCKGWKDVCSRFSDLNIGVTDLLERSNLNEGDDIADIYLETIKPRPQPVVKVPIKFDPLEGMMDDPLDMSAEFDRIMATKPEQCPF